MTRVLSMVTLFCLNPFGVARAGEAPVPAAFDRLRSLAGNWEGTFQWSGARSDSGRMNATYHLTGNGSAVVETLIQEDVPVMTTLYHTDGADLRLTHFCAAQNQPRLKASRIDEEQGLLEFSFVDITNLPTPGAAHVDGLELRFLGPDRIRLTFTFVSDGARSYERIDLGRVP